MYLIEYVSRVFLSMFLNHLYYERKFNDLLFYIDILVARMGYFWTLYI